MLCFAGLEDANCTTPDRESDYEKECPFVFDRNPDFVLYELTVTAFGEDHLKSQTSAPHLVFFPWKNPTIKHSHSHDVLGDGRVTELKLEATVLIEQTYPGQELRVRVKDERGNILLNTSGQF